MKNMFEMPSSLSKEEMMSKLQEVEGLTDNYHDSIALLAVWFDYTLFSMHNYEQDKNEDLSELKDSLIKSLLHVLEQDENRRNER